MRKFSIIFLALMCVLTTSAFASDGTKQEKLSLNEYEITKQLSLESEQSLRKKGFSTIEIVDLKNYKSIFSDHYETLSELGVDVLEKHGYTDEQIQTFQTFNGDEEQMQLLSAGATIQATAGKFQHSPGELTIGSVSYEWNWSGIPAFKRQDLVAFAWNDWLVTDESSSVKYYNVNTGKYYRSYAATHVPPEEDDRYSGAGHEIEMAKSDNYYYAKTGSGTFILESDATEQKNFDAYVAYGHTRIKIIPGFTVTPGSSSPTLSFVYGCFEEDYDRVSFKF